MARTVKLNKTSTQNINKWLKTIDIENKEQFTEKFHQTVLFDVKHIKECSEKSIVDFYISCADTLIKHTDYSTDEFWYQLKEHARQQLSNKYTTAKSYDNNIDIYFNEVKKEYIKHPVVEQDNIEFLPENREIFIKNNLKLSIECAKRYQGLGVTFEDLIQAGNEGLLKAFDKFDKDRANLRISIKRAVSLSDKEVFSYEDALDILKKGFTYTKLFDDTAKKLPKDGFISKDKFYDWIEKNVKTAVFASVAFQWIRAYILLEINNFGKVIRIPKTYKDKTNTSTTIVRLDSVNPHTDDCYHDNQLSEVTNEEFAIIDEEIENSERQDMFKSIIKNVFYKLSNTERRIIKKRFGIDVPFQLGINEIAESEGLTTNKVKYIITTSLKTINENITGEDRQIIIEMLK